VLFVLLVRHTTACKNTLLLNHSLRLVAIVSNSSQLSRLTPAKVCANGYLGSSRHPMVRQLVSKVQDVELIGALSHEAPKVFDGIGGLNMSVLIRQLPPLALTSSMKLAASR